MGATGDAEHFERLAELLADDFTVVTYDRRRNGRSPRPPGWASTSAEEQAHDAAALLQGLGLAPVAVFATSLAGVIALCLVLRHPRAVSAAILHEPAFWSLFDDPEEVKRTVGAKIADGMRSGGPREAIERSIALLPATRTGKASIPSYASGCAPAPRPTSRSSGAPSPPIFLTRPPRRGSRRRSSCLSASRPCPTSHRPLAG